MKLLRAVCFIATLAAVSPVFAQEYTIGAGDVLTILVWGQADLSRDYPVDNDGFVPFPLLGRVKATGLTSKKFAETLRDLLEKDYLVNPQVQVSVKEYLSRKVHVLGEAERPGRYYIGQTTLLEVLSKAGGLSKGTGKQLIVYRNQRAGPGSGSTGNIIIRVSIEKLQAGDGSENIRLEDEDTVFVPKARAFFVLGEVRNPGTFPLESETTALEAVTKAGWFNDKAAPGSVKVTRRESDRKQENFSLDLSGSSPKNGDFKIEDGDTILVPRGNTFFVFGQVKSPGAYLLDKETNILEGITRAGGFTDKAAPSRTRVIRNTGKGQQTLDVDMNDVIKRGQRDKAIILKEDDVVVVPESFF